jgi:AraC-like DNA-binding protein
MTERVNLFRLEELTQRCDFSIRDERCGARSVPPHRHEYLQIQFNLAGRTEHWLNGARLPVEPGTVSFVAPYRVHTIPRAEGARHIVINLNHRFLRPDIALDPLDLEDVPIESAPELAPFVYQHDIHFRLAEPQLSEAHSLCVEMMRADSARTLCSISRIRALLTLFLTLVVAPHETEIMTLHRKQVHVSRRRQWLKRVAAFLRENLHEPVTLAEAAAAAHLSPTYLANALKKETGRTFVETLTERRMERAKELLLCDAIRVADVARAVGFEDESYFARRFKQRYGLTPTEMRGAARAAAQ